MAAAVPATAAEKAQLLTHFYERHSSPLTAEKIQKLVAKNADASSFKVSGPPRPGRHCADIGCCLGGRHPQDNSCLAEGARSSKAEAVVDPAFRATTNHALLPN